MTTLLPIRSYSSQKSYTPYPDTCTPILDIDLASIANQSRGWLSAYDDALSQTEFIELMAKIAPFVRRDDTLSLFASLDLEQTDTVSKDVLLQGNYLANLIAQLYLNHDMMGDHDDDQKIQLSNRPSYQSISALTSLELQNDALHKENDELKRWIIEVGKPAEERANRLQQMLQMYQQENEEVMSEMERLRVEQTQATQLALDIGTLSLSHNLARDDNEALTAAHKEQRRALKAADKNLRASQDKISQLETLNASLLRINADYKRSQQQLQSSAEKEADAMQNMRALLIEQDAQLQALLSERVHMEREMVAIALKHPQEHAKDTDVDSENEFPHFPVNNGHKPMQINVSSAFPNKDANSLFTVRTPMASPSLHSNMLLPKGPAAYQYQVPRRSTRFSVSLSKRLSRVSRIDRKDIAALQSMDGFTISVLDDEADGHDAVFFDADEEDDEDEFFRETLRKEIELELRHTLKQELEHHFEIRAQQIRVDAQIERQKEMQQCRKEMETVRNELVTVTEKYNALKQTYKTETKAWKQKIIDLSNRQRSGTNECESNDLLDDEYGHQSRVRSQRTRTTRQMARHQVCGVTPACSMPSFLSLFSRKK